VRAMHLKIKKSSKDITNGVGLLNQIRQGMGVSEYLKKVRKKGNWAMAFFTILEFLLKILKGFLRTI
jgi:hypothetical protein